MRGVITGLKSHASCFYFITGEDGIEYYSRPGFLAEKKVNGNKVWDKYVWNGNGCEFDPEEGEHGKGMVARNVTPDCVVDPNYGVRKANRVLVAQEHRAAEERKKAKKIANLMEQKRIREEAAQRMALKDLNKAYVLQRWENGEWVDYRLYTGKRVIFKTVREANMFCFEVKKTRPGERFRYVKREIIHGVR
jgi:hypothetical protein